MHLSERSAGSPSCRNLHLPRQSLNRKKKSPTLVSLLNQKCSWECYLSGKRSLWPVLLARTAHWGCSAHTGSEPAAEDGKRFQLRWGFPGYFSLLQRHRALCHESSMIGFRRGLGSEDSNPKVMLSHHASSLQKDISSQERASSKWKLQVREGGKSPGPVGWEQTCRSGHGQAIGRISGSGEGLREDATNESGIESISFPNPLTLTGQTEQWWVLLKK